MTTLNTERDPLIANVPEDVRTWTFARRVVRDAEQAQQKAVTQRNATRDRIRQIDIEIEEALAAQRANAATEGRVAAWQHKRLVDKVEELRAEREALCFRLDNVLEANAESAAAAYWQAVGTAGAECCGRLRSASTSIEQEARRLHQRIAELERLQQYVRPRLHQANGYADRSDAAINRSASGSVADLRCKIENPEPGCALPLAALDDLDEIVAAVRAPEGATFVLALHVEADGRRVWSWRQGLKLHGHAEGLGRAAVDHVNQKQRQPALAGGRS